MESSYLKITVMPTEQCNFRCSYCYEQFKYGNMDNKYLNLIYEFVSNKLRNSKYIKCMLDWFGGEPTLSEKGLISNFTRRMSALTKAHDVKFHSAMTTNGYLLSKGLFLEYVNSGVNMFQITIDGMKHDLTRISCDGHGTFSQIIDNIRDIHNLPENIDFTIYLRYNIFPENYDFSWYEYIGNLLEGDPRFSILIRPVSDLGGEKVKTLHKYSASEWKYQEEQHIKKASSCNLKVANLLEDNPFSQVCFASYKDSYIFRSNGDIVKCSSHIDDPRNIIGHIDSNQGIVIDSAKNQRWTSFAPEKECFSCPDLGACLNKRCPYLRLENNVKIYCDKVLNL